jgi:hypothetical protein
MADAPLAVERFANMPATKQTITVNGVEIEYYFQRRRYGSTTYTWLNYRIVDGGTWDSYGDPWPSLTIPKKELTAAFQDIATKEADRCQTIL